MLNASKYYEGIYDLFVCQEGVVTVSCSVDRDLMLKQNGKWVKPNEGKNLDYQ